MGISKETRKDILDTLKVRSTAWNGALDEISFLERIWRLDDLPSTDHRFTNAGGDIWQHRFMNDDWPSDWLFYDDRFQLLGGSDEDFLRFLAEMLHPVVRTDEEEIAALLTLFNDCLTKDSWELVEERRIGGRPVYAARPVRPDRRTLADAARAVAVALDSEYVSRQVQRMESNIDSNPDLAIGTAKEFVETICKTILRERAVEVAEREDLPGLTRKVIKELRLMPQDIPDEAKASDTIRRLLMSFSTLVQGLTEVRNAYGTGHGKDARASGLLPRHAQLAVSAAIALGVFLFQTHQVR